MSYLLKRFRRSVICRPVSTPSVRKLWKQIASISLFIFLCSGYAHAQSTPAINSLTSTQGGVGQWVEILGSNFGSSQGTSTVKFNGVAATALQWASGYVNVNVPSGATTGPVVVTVAGVASNGVTFTVITTPYIASINPPSGGVGQGVSLYGSNFGSSQGSSTVTFNGVAATVSGWTNTNVNVAVPTGATTGNIVVTVGGAASNGLQFIVNQAPVITSSNSVIFATGNSGSFTVTATGSPAPALSESGALPSGVTFVAGTGSLSGTPPSGTAGSYPITFTASNGVSPNATQNFTLTVAIPPAVISSVSPTPNSSGWVNINATVTFTCTAGTYAIANCPGPQTVSTDGAGQIVSGTVTDTHGLTASTSVTINLDKTIPTLTVTSPADQTSESSSPVTVSATLTDALSGVSGVTCDGVAASLSGGSFSCNISLSVGVNLVIVRGTDIAGNAAGDNFHLSLTGALPAPTSLQVTPTGVNMVVGGTQQFTVVDQQGRPRSDATWGVDNTSIATIDTNSSPTLTAVATGTATLTATVGSVTAQTQVTILSGTSLPVGTVLWSAPTPSGYSVLQTLQAVPTIGSPDLYSVQTTSGGQVQVAGLTADGQQLWSSAPISFGTHAGAGVHGVPDGSGGILLMLYPGYGLADSIVDLDGQTGAQAWSYNSTGTISNEFAPFARVAVGPDGSVHFTDATYDPGTGNYNGSLVGLDGMSGAVKSRYKVPYGIDVINDDGTCGYTGSPETFVDYSAWFTDPVVGPDGTVMVGQSVYSDTLTYGCTIHLSTDKRLSLVSMATDGTTSVSLVYDDTTLHPNRTSQTGTALDAVIPDGSGGALVSWEYDDPPAGSQQAFHITDVSSNGTSDFTVPLQIQNSGATQMVLGDNNATLFVSDGFVVDHVNLPGGSPIWTYTPSSIYDSTNMIVGLQADSLSILNSSGQAPYTQTLLSLDTTGTPSPSGTAVTGLPSPWALGNWVGNMSGSFSMFVGIPNILALSDYVTSQGNRQQQNAPPIPVLSEFVPFAPCDNTNGTCNTPDKAGDQIQSYVQSVKIPVRQKIFTDLNTTRRDRRPAAIDYLRHESATPRDALALITHSYLEAVPASPPPFDGISYSIGLNFADAFLIRTPDPSQTWLNYGGSFPTNPDQNGNFLVFLPQLNTNAKVIFIGACDVLHDVLTGFWNINGQTQGRALVVPDLVASNLANAGLVDLWHATNVWEHMATGLLAGQTLQQAVDAANAWLLVSGIPTATHPAETWKIIGDASVRLKP